jgi:hypothetical protein
MAERRDANPRYGKGHIKIIIEKASDGRQIGKLHPYAAHFSPLRQGALFAKTNAECRTDFSAIQYWVNAPLARISTIKYSIEVEGGKICAMMNSSRKVPLRTPAEN